MPSYEMIQVEGVIFNTSTQDGALVVYCHKRYKGRNANVSFNGERFGGNGAAVQIMERRVNGSKRYIAVFPSLPIGRH